MRVKWNRSLDGSQAQQNPEEQTAPDKVGSSDTSTAGGFLKIFRLKRHKKGKHGDSPGNRQQSTDDSFESYRQADDGVSRPEIVVLPPNDDTARSVCEEPRQYTSNRGVFHRSVSVSQSRRGSEDLSELKYRSLPSVRKGWFSFASRKSWLNLSSRGHNRAPKDDKRISASSQSIPAKGLKKTEKLIEEKLLRESPEKFYSENSFPSNEESVLNTSGSRERKKSSNSSDGSNQVDIESCSFHGEDGLSQSLDKSCSKKYFSKIVECGDDYHHGNGKTDVENSICEDKNTPEVCNEVKPQELEKENRIVKNEKLEISVEKKNHLEENHCRGKIAIHGLTPASFGNTGIIKNRNLFSPIAKTEKHKKSSVDDDISEDRDPPPSLAGNYHTEVCGEQSVTNDTLLLSESCSREEDAALFSPPERKQDRTSVCQTEQQQQRVTVEGSGEHNNSLPCGDNGEKNQQRNGIPTGLTTTATAFGSSLGQMKSAVESGINPVIARGDQLLPSWWTTEVTHRAAQVADTSKAGRNVDFADEIADPVMYSSPGFTKLYANDINTKKYMPMCEFHSGTDISKNAATRKLLLGSTDDPEFRDRTKSSLRSKEACKSVETSGVFDGDKSVAKPVFHDCDSANSNLLINPSSGIPDQVAGFSSCEESISSSSNCVRSLKSQIKLGETRSVQEKVHMGRPQLWVSEDTNCSGCLDTCEIHVRECDDPLCYDTKRFSDTTADDICRNSSVDVHDMNQRNISVYQCANSLQVKKNVRTVSDENNEANINQCISPKHAICGRDFNGNSCATDDHFTDNSTKTNSSSCNLASSQSCSSSTVFSCNTVPDTSSAHSLNEDTRNCSTVRVHCPVEDTKDVLNLPFHDSGIGDSYKDRSSSLSSTKSVDSAHSSFTGVSGEKDFVLNDTCGDVNPQESGIKRTDTKKICGALENGYHETFTENETDFNCNKTAAPASQTKIRIFAKNKDVFEDILQKSVSSDSGISEEIPEMSTEELKCENLHKTETKDELREDNNNKKFIDLFSPSSETTSTILCNESYVDFKQLDIKSQKLNSEAGINRQSCDEKNIVPYKHCPEQQYFAPNFSDNVGADPNEVVVDNFVQGEYRSNSSPESELRQNVSFNACSEEMVNSVHPSDEGVTELMHKALPDTASFSINLRNENFSVSSTNILETPSSKHPFSFSEFCSKLHINERSLPSYFETSTRFYDIPSCYVHNINNMMSSITFGQNKGGTSGTIKIFTLDCNGSSYRTYYCKCSSALCGGRTSSVVDIFSSTEEYPSVCIFCVNCHRCGVTCSSWCTNSHCTTFPSASVCYNPLMWENTDHLKFEETRGDRTSEYIPITLFVKDTDTASDQQHDSNLSPTKLDAENSTPNFASRPSTSFETDVDSMKTADKNTQCESISNCESETVSAVCGVESARTDFPGYCPVPSGQVEDTPPDKPMDSSDRSATPISHHPLKQNKRTPMDITESSKERSVPRKSRIPRKHGSVRVLHHPSPKPIRPPMWLSKAELSQEIQHLGTLCEARTKELNLLKMKLKHATLGFDAFAAVFKYLTEDLDALSHPQLVKELAKTQNLLHQAKSDIICYEKKIEELKTHHAKELAELSEKMLHVYQSELQQVTNKQNEELTLLEEQHQKKMLSLQTSFMEASEKAKTEHKKEVEDIRQKFFKQKEEAELLHQSEMKHLEESHLEVQKSLQSEIDQLKMQYAESKQQSRSIEETLQKDTDTKLQWIASKKADLEKEVDSLKTVLEMKNNEIHSLRKENLEMQKELEELPMAKEKIKMLQARAEDLQALMADKVRGERQLLTEHQSMKEVFERESKLNKRLSMENEELQWRLKQTSELSLRSQSNSPDVLETPSPPRSKFFIFADSPECDPESPQAKSPAPATSSRSKFFTFVDPSEYDAQSPHSPRYKRLTPSQSSSPCKQPPLKTPVKLPLASTPRKSKVVSEAQPSGATPRKMSKNLSGKCSPIYPLLKTSDEEAADAGSVANNIPESMESSMSSDDSALLSRDLEAPTTEELRHGKNADFESLEYEKSAKPESDVSILGEATDPKKYYHMTFPVLKETGPDCDVDDGSNYLLVENNENCFLTAKETDYASATRNGYGSTNGGTTSEPDDHAADEFKDIDFTLERMSSHKMNPSVKEMVDQINSENSSRVTDDSSPVANEMLL